MKRHTKLFLTEMLLIILICGYNKVFILAIVWIVVHELSHIVVARMIGCRFFNMELHIFGAKANLIDLEYVTDKQKLCIYLAGPFINILVTILFVLLRTQIQSKFIDFSIDLNLGLAMFNLLPAYPLDGARIYEILLTRKMLYKKAHKIIAILSYVTGILLILVAFGLKILLNDINISLLISATIILYLTRKEEETLMYVTMGNIVKKRKFLIKNKYIENKSISVYYKHCLVNVLGLIERNRFNTFYVLDDEMRLCHILHEDELITALKLYGNITLEEYINNVCEN